MLEVLARELARRDQVRLFGGLGFENAYAFAMTRSRAQRLGIRDLDSMARASTKLRLATDLEFLNRPEWEAVARHYHPAFRQARPYSPTFMYRALSDGSADVITAFSSDGRIAAMDLVTLSDPLGALPHYDAVILLTKRGAQDARLVAALQRLIGAIPIETMRQANGMVDRDADKQTVHQAAAWLETKLELPR
jgi:osmoprotectant transport system permease protein